MTTWDPAQYLRFEDQRLRPALDLLARVPLRDARSVYDLGCGPGTVTAPLRERWPDARLTGVDASKEMLKRAAKEHPEIAWSQGDIDRWRPEAPADVIYSSSALHWLGHHETLLPRLLGELRPGGVLAVQIPDNFDAPTHVAIDETLRSRNWSATPDPETRPRPGLGLAAYYDLLSPRSAELDLWRTTYVHVLEGEDPVVEWIKGSALRPVLEALAPSERESFVEAYRDRVGAAYPRRPDGKTLLPYARIFLVATAR